MTVYFTSGSKRMLCITSSINKFYVAFRMGSKNHMVETWLSDSRETLSQELAWQQTQVASFLQERLDRTYSMAKQSQFTVPNAEGAPRLCQMQIYSTQTHMDPLDESSLIELLFPKKLINCKTVDFIETTAHFGQDPGWLFAEMAHWNRPSMAIFTNYEAFPLKWLARIQWHNPLAEFDYQIYAVLD